MLNTKLRPLKNKHPYFARIDKGISTFFLICAFILHLALSPSIDAVATDFEHLLINFTQRFGNTNTSNFQDWQKLVLTSKDLSTQDKIKRVNEFFNRRIQFADDKQVWAQSDYWATPLETIGKGAGDCEDFTIAKYFTLLNTGIPNQQLRLVYVKARIGGMNSTIEQAHMVLAFYASPEAEPLILDNLITEIRPASRRPDLQPVFSFNSDGIWTGANGDSQSSSDSGRLSRWQDLLQRTKKEGFD